MQIKLNNQIDTQLWDDLLMRSSYASPFQSKAFYDIYNTMLNHTASAVAVEENGKYIALAVITTQKESGVKGIFSKRAIVYAGPMIESSEAMAFLLKEVVALLKNKVIYIEMRNYFDFRAFHDAYQKLHWKYIPYMNAQIELQGRSYEQILLAMNATRRRQIKLSYKNNCLTKIAETEQELSDWYKIIKNLYQTKVKLPIPNFDYFHTLWKKQDLVKLFVVQYEGVTVGGAFCLFLDKHNMYTYYYCGLENVGSNIFPAHLAIDTAIRYGLEHGIKVLDLMGAGNKNEIYGVRTYKERFGANISEQGRYMYVCRPLFFAIGKVGLQLLKKL